MIDLPAARSRSALEWANDVAGDPPGIEVAFLHLHLLAIDETRVHFARVKSISAARSVP